MTSFDPFSSIIALGIKLRSGELSSEDITRVYLDRIRKYDGALRAFVEIFENRALEEAREADANLNAGIDYGPLHGIPYAIKDLYDVAGVPTRAGTDLLSENVPKVMLLLFLT
mgnify:FL=1